MEPYYTIFFYQNASGEPIATIPYPYDDVSNAEDFARNFQEIIWDSAQIVEGTHRNDTVIQTIYNIR